MTPRRNVTEQRVPTLGGPDGWCNVIRQRLQAPLNRLTCRERFDLLSALGKLGRTFARYLPSEARALQAQAREKLAQESPESLTEVLASHPLGAWSQWTVQAMSKATPELLWQMLTALDDTEAAVAIVAGLRPRSIAPDLDDLLSRCRTWIERNGELFAALRPEVEKLVETLQPSLDEENYDLAVTTLKFEAILDPIPTDEPVEPAPFTSAVLDALLRKPG
jgi:hypothetical protein